jgi:DNA-binding MarR family transcriptional regulator
MATLEGLDYEVWRVLHLAHDAFKLCEDAALAQKGLTSEQYQVLVAIEALGEPVRPTDIARWTGHSANSVSMLLERMVKGHLLTRRRDKKDRRVVWLNLTRRGSALVEPSIQLHQELLQQLFSRIPAGEKTMLVNRLRVVHSTASEYLDERK